MRNWSTVDYINDDELGEPSVRELTEAIYDRAEQDMRRLLVAAKDAFDEGVKGLLRVGELHRTHDSWEVWSHVFMPSRPKKRIGSAGLYFDLDDNKGPFLVGFVRPLGGQPGLNDLMRACKNQGLYKIDNHVVWTKMYVTPNTTRDEVCLETKLKAKAVFKAAMGVLKDIADKKK